MNAFDRLVGSDDTAMVVVTTAAGDERSGCLVGFHSQCSIEPTRYAVWISKANHTHDVALLADRVAVHWLSAPDHDLAEHFGSLTGDVADKFAGVPWTDGGDGLPLLDAVPNRVVGRVVDRHDDGDHTCTVVEVDEATCAEPFEPLRFRSVRDLDPGHEA